MIVQLKGALGNQMFQYAFGRAASLRLGSELILDIEGYNHQSKFDTPRQYSLDAFAIQATIAPREEVLKYYSPLYRIYQKLYSKYYIGESTYTFNPRALPHRPHGYYQGYWQHEQYFKDYADIIRNDFILKKPLSTEALRFESDICSNVRAVSMHIRRGDYVHNPIASEYHGVLPLNYYRDALTYIGEKIGFFKLYIFSDDIPWITEHAHRIVPAGIEIEFVSRPALMDYEELILMSLCGHHIIANSSYSWWGAWLNYKPEKIVIAPKQWLKDGTRTDIVPPEWTTLDIHQP